MEKLELFFIVLSADMIAMLIFMLIKDGVEKHVTIFDTWKNLKLYNLSFLYARARELRTQGFSDNAICTQLKKEFDNNALPFLQYPPKIPNTEMSKRKANKYKARLENYHQAVNFIGKVVSDKTLLEKYVIHENFGKGAFKELTKEMSLSDKEVAARNALQLCLVDESDNNVCTVMSWFPSLFINPVKCDQINTEKIGKIENASAVFFALTCSSTFLKKNLSLRAYVNCLSCLQEIYPTMKIAKSAGDISKYSQKVQTSNYWESWKKAIIDMANNLHKVQSESK